MKFKFILLSTIFSASFYSALQAQSIDDAVIFSKDDVVGSARLKGMGNVQTALGGDVSAINGNPAGLGFFRRSDISFTLNYLNNTNKTSFEGMNNSSKKGNFGIDQAGVVFHFPTSNYNSAGWQNFNIGLSYNKSNNFHNNLTYEGNNNTTSITNALSDIMDGDFATDFAGSNMVERFGNGKNGYFPLAAESAQKNQYNNVITNGNRSKTALSFGANYNNSFYIGASLGLTSISYDRKSQFIENGWTKNTAEILANNPNSTYADPTHENYDFVEASYELFDNSSRKVSGSGLDFKLGMIFKPSTDWNIGISINTPTWTTMKDDDLTYTDIDFYDNENSASSFFSYESDTYEGILDYQLSTPWKIAAGVTKFFPRGLIAVDGEVVTYNTIRYNDNNFNNSYSGLNSDISNDLKSALNFRIGGEYLISNILSGRAGFNYFGNPYRYFDETNYSGSIGLGVKLTNSMYMDFAVVHQVNSYSEAPYSIDETFWNKSAPVADIKNNRTNAAVTLGFKF